MLRAEFQREYMCLRQIHDVDVITYAGAVGRGVVVAKHLHPLAPSDRNLGHSGRPLRTSPGQPGTDAVGFVGDEDVCEFPMSATQADLRFRYGRYPRRGANERPRPMP